MRHHIRSAFMIFALLTILTGIIYPLAVTVIAQVFYPSRSNGSLLIANGKAVGSRLIGQPFDNPKYLWGRLSATAPVPYNAAASSGSNLGPSNPELEMRAADRITAIRKADTENIAPVPADLATASASGLDPDISPAAAEFQIRRIAVARGIDEAVARSVVALCTGGRQYGLLGEPRVNVLCVNLALDGVRSDSVR